LGYAPVGDAICSFDPTFGQGMSVAAQEAVALSRALAEGLESVRDDYPRKAARLIDCAWVPMQGEVLQIPGTIGELPRGHRLVSAYTSRLKRVARHDPEVAAAFMRVMNLMARPRASWRPACSLGC
jgi:flavin-dependent dehydrogenase